jgi:hypothetical protein
MLVSSLNWPLALAGIGSGAATHIHFYRYGEWDVSAPKLVLCYFALLAATVGLDAIIHQINLEVPLPPHWGFNLVGLHILGIYVSMLFYRAFLHRLSAFPGPFFAKLSNFYVTYLSAKNLQLYEETERLHKKYGDYVRLGKGTVLWCLYRSLLGVANQYV